jgi:hypothetical protein
LKNVSVSETARLDEFFDHTANVLLGTILRVDAAPKL